MKELVGRVELLMVTMVIVASCLLIPAAKPHIDVRQSAVEAFDNLARLRGECQADMLKDRPGVAAYERPLNTYSRRLYSEEAPSRPPERWILINAVPVSVLLELQTGLQATWVSYHDMWDDPGQDYKQCPGYLSALGKSADELLVAYYYTGAENPATTPLVDLDSKFNASIKVPYLDGSFSFLIVLRIVFVVVCFSLLYLIVLLGSLRGISGCGSLLDYGPLIFCQSSRLALFVGIVWLLAPFAIFIYLLWAQIASGTEVFSFTVIVLVCTVWLITEVYRFRGQVLSSRTNPGPQPDGTADAAPHG